MTTPHVLNFLFKNNTMKTPQNTTKATARPWYRGVNGGRVIQILQVDPKTDEACGLIAEVNKGISRDCNGQSDEADANAALIVQAVNQFDALNAVAVAADAVYKGSFSQDDKRKLIQALSTLATLKGK